MKGLIEGAVWLNSVHGAQLDEGSVYIMNREDRYTAYPR